MQSMTMTDGRTIQVASFVSEERAWAYVWRSKPGLTIVLGDFCRFWIVTNRDAGYLTRGGYELAPKPSR